MEWNDKSQSMWVKYIKNVLVILFTSCSKIMKNWPVDLRIKKNTDSCL